VTTDALERALAGDDQAFGEVTGPYLAELRLHCYRILGSVQDAEDVLQETLLAAWRGLGQYEGRAALRTWLYRIATNRCLNALRADRRRPRPEPPEPPFEPPRPTRRGSARSCYCATRSASAPPRSRTCSIPARRR
jgi:RNA polymerase sigma factor (sigma-70 family)